MLLRPVLLTIALCLTAMLPAAEPDMRDRVFCDPVSQTSFRFPYRYRIVDQYAGHLVDAGQGMFARRTNPQVEITIENGQRVMRVVEPEAARPAYTVLHFSVTPEDLPGEVVAGGLAAVAAHVAETEVDATPYDYYADPEARPHAGEKWAPEGIEGMTWTSADGRGGIILAHDGRYSGLKLAGDPSSSDYVAIVDSFEVLSNRNARRNREVMTWREGQFRQGKVFTRGGDVVSGRTRSDPRPWDQAWEVETAHYHVTTTVEPRQALYFAAYMEALYETFYAVFDPDSMPPYKMEIHITQTVHDMIRLAGTLGIHGLQDGSTGSLTGGFFAPGLLAIVAFNDPVPNYPTRVDKTLAHEASHQFLHVTCNGSQHVPTWINEGLAVYFEAGEFRSKRFNWAPPRERIDLLSQTYRQTNRTLWPLDNYINHYGHIAASQYGEAYAMTHFLVFASSRGLELFKQYWQALRDGRDGGQAFDEIFMAELIEIHGSRAAAIRVWEEALRNYVASGALMRSGAR